MAVPPFCHFGMSVRFLPSGHGHYKRNIIDVLKDVLPELDTDEGRRLTLVEECHDRWVENARTSQYVDDVPLVVHHLLQGYEVGVYFRDT